MKYQSLHRKLVKLFEWRGLPYAESLADETIDSVIRKLDEVDIQNVNLHVIGVASNVLKENRHITTRSSSLDELPTAALSLKPCEDETRRAEELERERRLACLGRTMRALSEKERNLIIRNYQSQTSFRKGMSQARGSRTTPYFFRRFKGPGSSDRWRSDLSGTATQ